MSHSLSARPDLGTKSTPGILATVHKDDSNTGTSTSSNVSTPPRRLITNTANDFPPPLNPPTPSNYASPPSSPATSTTTTIQEGPGKISPEFSTENLPSSPPPSPPVSRSTDWYENLVAIRPILPSLTQPYPWLKNPGPVYDLDSDPLHFQPCLQCKAVNIKCSFTAFRQRKPQWLGFSHCSRCWREGEPECLKAGPEPKFEYYKPFQRFKVYGKPKELPENRRTGPGADVDVLELARRLKHEKWWKREWEDWALPRDDPKGRRGRVTSKVRKRWGRFDFGSGMEGDVEGEDVEAEEAQMEMLKWVGVEADVGSEEKRG